MVYVVTALIASLPHSIVSIVAAFDNEDEAIACLRSCEASKPDDHEYFIHQAQIGSEPRPNREKP